MTRNDISAKELFEQLNLTDECNYIEAKPGSKITDSVMETVCAFANEPDLGGGFILLGISEDESTLFNSYKVTGVSDPDKMQMDLSSRCASEFNVPIRPQITVEKIEQLTVLKIFIPENPKGSKPVYFKNQGMPAGAMRRIGSTDQHCTEDDMRIFFESQDSFDHSLLNDTSLDDIDGDAISLYKKMRKEVNPLAEELNYSDEDLLIALGCAKKQNGIVHLTVAGLLVFGKAIAHRRIFPMVRVDYIRVPGNEWIQDPENRFTAIDMRGPLILTLSRAYAAIADDLPKGFLLNEGELQAQSKGLPGRALREVLVNALIHRSYRVHQPIQIIRYGNRIEIKNPGYSLKPEEQLGEPGSQARNPFIAAIFHETHLAETKGSGIRSMRKFMQDAGLTPPTFESDHAGNTFTSRLLLHHFLSEKDIKWINLFDHGFEFTQNQKLALIFIREVGAIDNSAYRQLTGLDLLKASAELRQLRDLGFTLQKGKGKSTYYVPSEAHLNIYQFFDTIENKTLLKKESINHDNLTDNSKDHIEPAQDLIEPVPDLIEPVPGSLLNQLPQEIKDIISKIGKRSNDPELLKEVILALCKHQPLKISQLAAILGRRDKYLLTNFISPLKEAGKLKYSIPDMPNHPDQAYITVQ